jgi:hypothetical protein
MLLVALGASGTALLSRGRAHPSALAAAASAPPVAALGAAAPDPTRTPPATVASHDDAADPPPAGPHALVVTHAAGHGKTGGAPAANSRAVAGPAAPAPGAPSAVASVAAAPPAAPSAPAVASDPTSNPIAAAGVVEAPAADPTFDPARAYVEIGMVNVENVKEQAVRAALHGLALGQCYRSSLKAKGARAPGVATLNLSFDESGVARSAVVTGADFLPGLARCVQDASVTIRIGSAQVESGGGVAEVTLGFREP